jgi:hypothetical protein
LAKCESEKEKFVGEVEKLLAKRELLRNKILEVQGRNE